MRIPVIFSNNTNVAATSATVATAAASSNAANAVADIIAARAAHDVWYNGSYKASNAELYNILAKCLDAYMRMAGKHEQVAAFRAECEQKGLKFHNGTPVLNRIVAYVFGKSDRRRVSAYARVLGVAYADKQDPTTLHTWIAGQGGIEEIKAKASGGMTTTQRIKQRVEKATAAAPALKPVAKISNAKVQMDDAASPYVVGLARVTANGAVEVLTFINEEKAVDAALAAYGAKLTAAEQTDARVNKAVSTANAMAAAIAA